MFGIRYCGCGACRCRRACFSFIGVIEAPLVLLYITLVQNRLTLSMWDLCVAMVAGGLVGLRIGYKIHPHVDTNATLQVLLWLMVLAAMSMFGAEVWMMGIGVAVAALYVAAYVAADRQAARALS